MTPSGPADEDFSTETIRWETDADGIVTLTLDDPSAGANTMNDAYRRSMAMVVTRLVQLRAQNPTAVTGVIVTSAKSTFFAGGNLDDLIQAGPEDRTSILAVITQTKAQLRTLETLGVPVVAALNGTALGGGLEIALACHHRIALDTPRARFGFPEVTLGLLPGAGGVVRSVRLLGLATALTELLLRGQQLRPEQARKLGLIHELAADRDDLLSQARTWIIEHPYSVQPFDGKGYKVPGGTPASPSLAAVLPAFAATLVKQLKGANLPAPHHILCAAVEGLTVDVETAFTVEGRYFTDLVCGQISTNMIQAFWFDLNRVNGGGSRPAGVAKRVPTRVAVLGAGMMGAGIAYALAKSGLDVVLKDVSVEAAETGRQRVAQPGREAALGRIRATGDACDLAGCDAVIEAVFEDAGLKHQVFAEIEAELAPDALLCSNTSTLPITGLATGVKRPEDFIGLHFFSPVDRMPLVEIIVGELTSDETLARAYDLVRAIGKTPIVVNDRRGFFTSRVFGTLVLEGAALIGEGLAPMSVERAAQQAGFPAGPLTLMDEVTLTLMVKIEDGAAAAASPAGGAASPVGGAASPVGGAASPAGGAGSAAEATPEHPGVAVVRTMVENGRTGKSAGAGWYDWSAGKQLWPGIPSLFRPRPDGPEAVPFTDAQERMLFAMALETARCLQEGVLRSVPDANIGSILGIGFPAQFGGALQYIDQYPGGVRGFVTRAGELAERYGARFRPPHLLTGPAWDAGSVRSVR